MAPAVWGSVPFYFPSLTVRTPYKGVYSRCRLANKLTGKRYSAFGTRVFRVRRVYVIAKLKVLHAGRSHFFQSPEAVWDWLERSEGTGTLEYPHREGSGRHRGAVEVLTTARRNNRRHCTDCGGRVIARPDGTLILDRRRQEREEAKLLVQSVTSEASSRSRSPCGTERLSPETDNAGT
ncbi:hypothetical protein NDU88_004260 [Pleurodeles waltl]|uniref:Uncharacterized protein n=1 Tax=Pleurodeles waltl TaxID=8319 RepID=A0AAV7UGD2_PLEWA|nr:hypothetical protein NDU88_004260 [Pleurodeles waltl]